ncbi:hypothetical protein Pelo_17198 [Pelomyxa schiedti]|nr:hypothetical protein Pelo_17198 [Pelomyxa schiedti]
MSEAVEIATDVFVCICIAAFLVSLSGLTVHSIRNRKAFKRRNIFYLRFSMPHTSNGDPQGLDTSMVILTRSASTLGLPIDIRTSRRLFGLSSIIQLFIMVPTAFFGWLAVVVLVPPVCAIIAVIFVNVGLSLAFVIVNGITILYASYVAIAANFAGCDYLGVPSEKAHEMCEGHSASGDDTPGIIGVYVLLVWLGMALLTEMLAYAFSYKILRYKLFVEQTQVSQGISPISSYTGISSITRLLPAERGDHFNDLPNNPLITKI